jgi:CDP-diacylglycerol--serine O-phosphatidyltransferase
MIHLLKKMLPSACTLANLIFGLISLILTIEGIYDWAAVFVVVGMFFDGFDGRLARALGVSSEFGKQLDSLSDLITFGVAPAMLAYASVLSQLPAYLGLLVVLPFPLAGALRLARFNVITDKTHGYFIGMPITLTGGFYALALLYAEWVPPWAVIIVGLALAYLMVSTIHYPDFKTVGMSRAMVLFVLAIFVGAILVLRWHAAAVFMFPMAIYGLVGIKNNLVCFWHNKVKDRFKDGLKFKGGLKLRQLKLRKPRR